VDEHDRGAAAGVHLGDLVEGVLRDGGHPNSFVLLRDAGR
jgi:hypothetical protein